MNRDREMMQLPFSPPFIPDNDEPGTARPALRVHVLLAVNAALGPSIKVNGVPRVLLAPLSLADAR